MHMLNLTAQDWGGGVMVATGDLIGNTSNSLAFKFAEI